MARLRSLQRECHQRRSEYVHARQLYETALAIEIPDRTSPGNPLVTVDCFALHEELGHARLAYYAAHGALHTAIRAASGTGPPVH